MHLKMAKPTKVKLVMIFLNQWNPECKEALDELHRQHQKAIFDAM